MQSFWYALNLLISILYVCSILIFLLYYDRIVWYPVGGKNLLS